MEQITVDKFENFLQCEGIEYTQKGETFLISTDLCCGAGRNTKEKVMFYFDSCRLMCHKCQTGYSVYDFMKENDMQSLFFKYFPKDESERVSNFKIDIDCSYLALSKRFIKQSETIEEELSNYNQDIVEQYPLQSIFDWEIEGIRADIQSEFDIRYDTKGQRAIIPQKDIEGRNVCIRVRNFDLVKHSAKYLPLWYDGTSLINKGHKGYMYGEYYHREKLLNGDCSEIYLYEAEKSVMQMATMYGKDKIALALLGSNIKHSQVEQLLKWGCKTVILCMDKDFQNREEEIEYIAKLKRTIFKRLRLFFNLRIVWCRKGALGYKESPSDRGRQVFENELDIISEKELK